MPIQTHQNIVKNGGIASSEQAEIAILAGNPKINIHHLSMA
jgi:hypothetical protein